MERKIGEIFEYDGEWYQTVEAPIHEHSCNGCQGCKGVGGPRIFGGECNGNARKDGKFVIFKKLEKVGEPYEYFIQGSGIIMLQEYILKNSSYIWDDKKEVFVSDCHNGRVAIEIKQNKEDMEETKSAAEIINGINHGIEPMSSYRKDTEEKKVILGELVYKYINGKITYEAFEKEVIELFGNKGESKPTLKDFDFEAAKVGKPICTRDGRKARIICFDSNGGRPIVALITESDDEEEIPYKYHYDGSYNCQDIPSDLDLMMLPEKKEGWVNVYYNRIDGTTFSKHPYPSKEEAIKSAGTISNRIDTVKIFWEE